MNTDKKRKAYIDFLRLLAIYLVMFIHTGPRGFVYFTQDIYTRLYWLYCGNTFLVKIAVPLFFMISGAMLIPKEESLCQLFRKRIAKYGIVLVTASLISYLYCIRFRFAAFDWKNFYHTMITDQWATAYWFLYAYLAYLFMLPLIRKFAKSLSDRDFGYLFAMVFVIHSLPVLDFVIWKDSTLLNGNFTFFINVEYLVYSLLGYYLDSRLDGKYRNAKTLLMLGILSVLGIAVQAYVTTERATIYNAWGEAQVQDYMMTYAFFPAAFVFLGSRMLFEKTEQKPWVTAVLAALGPCTFGVMLFEQIYRDVTERVYFALEPVIGSVPACWLWILAAWILGYAVTYLARKIPPIRWLT